MYGSPHIWTLSKTLTVTASLVLAFLFAPTAYALDLGAVDSVTHGGKTIAQGDMVYRSDFSSITNNWTFDFSWPSSVGNTTAMLAVIRGTFGNIPGGIPQSGVNFDANFQAWPPGTNSITKSIGMPPLGGLVAQSGTYTVLVAQTNGTFNQSGTMQWFASGGTSGQEPVNYKLLTFTYNATDFAAQLPGALSSVQYGPRSIGEGEVVLQEDVAPNAGNPSQYWRFSFVWPNAVPNQQALVAVFKGTYGAVDGGGPAPGVNYAANLQAWAAGANTIGKFMGLPGLESGGAPGTYTVLVAERDPKFSSNSTDQEVLWFASGGAQGVAPQKYTTLTFTLTNPPKCCSSVLFLPGFMASRLYKDGEKLWEPGLFTDSTQLLLGEAGHPIIPGISAPEVLDSVGGTDIYESFLNSLDEMVGSEEGKIHQWETFPYDWRKAVTDPALLAGLAAKLDQLAADSNTGKVSIVAHSNGGLLAKALMVHLGNTEAAALVDKIVMVGSPQIGTPKAVGALLHGYEQGIPSFFPVLLSEVEARTLAQNMHGAYGLIPSAAYFTTVTEPMITFEGINSPFITLMINAYESVVGNTTEYREFLIGAEGRVDPSTGDLIHPEVLRAAQFDAAQALHASIDAWVPPAGIEVYQIAGWGEETVKGFDYKGREVCLEGMCYEQIRTLPQMTMDGDGTVVTPSALYMSTDSNNVHRYWFDLLEHNQQVTDKNHSTLFSAANLGDFILAILSGQPKALPFISIDAPKYSPEPRLRYFLHSPLNLSATDSSGRRISNNLTEIPGARFEKFGEVQYISLPASAAPTVNLDAYASGSFILDVQEVSGNSIVNQISFVGIPTTEDTKVSFSFPDGTIENVTPLEIDKNGDGTTDFSISATGDEIRFEKVPITIVAESKKVIVGSVISELTYVASGFVANESLERSDITGSAECTTTATSASPVGTYPITCTVGTLQSDYYSFDTFVAGTLTISYRFSGFLKPINDSAVNPSVFKAGSTVPIKFELLNAEGESVQAATAPEWLEPMQKEPLNAKRNERKMNKKPTRGEVYEWKPKQQQYQYNWNTKGYEPGYWYEVSAKLDDGTIKTIVIGLK
jgi:pimeloyl-ACP methyl ester carboxylesterase